MVWLFTFIVVIVTFVHVSDAFRGSMHLTPPVPTMSCVHQHKKNPVSMIPYYPGSVSFSKIPHLAITSLLGRRPLGFQLGSTSTTTTSPAEPTPHEGDIVKDFNNLVLGSMTDEDRQTVLKEAFHELSGGRGKLSFEEFIRWEELRSLVADQVVEEEEIKTIWINQCGSLETEADEGLFTLMNKEIDTMFDNAMDAFVENDSDDNDDEDVDDEDDGPLTEEQEQRLREALNESLKNHRMKLPLVDKESGEETGKSANEVEFDNDDYIDIFDPSVKPEELLQEEAVESFKQLFLQATSAGTQSGLDNEGGKGSTDHDLNGRISFAQFMALEPTMDLLENTYVAETTISQLWKHAVNSQNTLLNESSEELGHLTWSSFLRVMVRLEALIEQAAFTAQALNMENLKSYCQNIFQNLTQGQDQMTFDQFMNWDALTPIFDQQIMSKDEVKQLWNFETIKNDPSSDLDEKSSALDAWPTAALNFDGFLSLYETLEEQVNGRMEDGEDDENSSEDAGHETNVQE